MNRNNDESAMDMPTRLPPPPRVVRGGPGGAIWFLRIFILPHVLAGVFVTGLLALTLAVAALGTDVRASVTDAHLSSGRKGGTMYIVAYWYRFGAHTYSGSTSVGSKTYAAVTHSQGSAEQPPILRVRHFELGPMHYHVLVQEHSAWISAAGLLLVALFWNGILSVFVNAAWVAPIRTRRLVRNGQAAPGMIMTTRLSRGRSTSYYATFRFEDPATGLEIQREMLLPGKAQYGAAHQGGAVTVLFDPLKPRRALVYELCAYRVLDRV